MRIFITLFFVITTLIIEAQTTYNYDLNNTNIHFSPTPTGGGFSPQSNYATITKPLVAEPYPSNPQAGVIANTIHSGAGNINNVFFGGDLPAAGSGLGATAIPIFTKQTFSQTDFPIYLECNFYNSVHVPLYNESYIIIMPSNYQYFASPTTYVPPQTTQREGFLFGGYPQNLRIYDHGSTTQSTVVTQNPHNFASNGNWYNMKIILDEINGDLIIRNAKINNQDVIVNHNLGQISWLSSYRLGIAVDDLAEGFQIITDYSDLVADFEINDTTICVGECVDLTDLTTTSYCTNCNTFQWSIPDAVTTTSSQQNPNNICFQNSGTFPITLIASNNVETDTITKMITVLPSPNVNLGNDTILCNNQTLTLDATTPNTVSYLWSNNSTNSTLTVNSIGTYSVEVFDGNCSDYDTIIVDVPPILTVDLGNDTTLCVGEILTFDVTQPTANYLWQDGSTNSSFTITQAGTYFVTLSNACQTISDTIEVQYLQSQLQVDLGNDTVLCTGQSLILDVTNVTATDYLWQDGSTNSTFTVTQSGMYFVAVSDTCMTIMDTINVVITGDLPIIDLGNDTTLCQGDTLSLNAFSPIANTYLWNDGSTNSSLIVYTGGLFFAEATNNCGTTSDTINIQLLISELDLELGNDTTLCNGDILTFDVFEPTAIAYLWQDSSTNSTFEITQSGMYRVSVSDVCKTVTDSIFIEYITLEVDLGNDTAICEGRSFLLDVLHPNAESYLWHNGSTNPYFSVENEGQIYVTLENHCEVVSDTINVIVSSPAPLVPNLGNDQVLCPGQTVVLDATTENALNYVWQDSTEGVLYFVTEPGVYEVTVSNACLSRTEDIEFTADACCNLFVPDAFTPNEDGNNDIFYAYTNCEVSDFSMMIFDRWGGKLFETTDINQGWNGMKNGQILNNGVYVYMISFNDGFAVRKKEGSLTLIR